MKVFAASADSECIGGIGPFGDLCERLKGKTPQEQGTGVIVELAKIVSTVVGVVTIVAGLFFFIQFLTAAFAWITSGGDAQNLEKARQKIINALIGLILVVAAISIMGVLEVVFGIPFLLGTPEKIAEMLTP